MAMVIALSRNWWALALRGLVDVLFGVSAFAFPGIALAALVLAYGAFALVGGIFAVAAALVGRTHGIPWWSLLVEGIFGIAVGVITFLWPGITELALLYLIAFWALVTGVLEIVAAIRLRKEIQGEWLLGAAGVLSILLAVVLIARPGTGALAVIWTIGAYAIAFGVFLIVLGFRLRSWSPHHRTVAST
jgi:uncharacterized membrane protein HdeD (DUF308 family)